MPDRLDDDQIRSLCGVLAVVKTPYANKSHCIVTVKSFLISLAGNSYLMTDALHIV